MHRIVCLLLLVSPAVAFAADGTGGFTSSGFGLCALAVFVIAYGLVIAEEMTELRKSIPVLIAAGIVWMLVAAAWSGSENRDAAEALRENLIEYAELLLFLLSAMTYVNTLQERDVFAALRSWLIARGLSLRSVFWMTGLMAFWLSPVLDNLTTALVMGAVVIAMGGANRSFVVPACINIVVAANAGGAFSPFGDITTLMVWQKGVVNFFEFFALLLPALANWLVPAVCMSFAIPSGKPAPEATRVRVKYGAGLVVSLFAATIAGTVTLHQFLHLPPFIGMMTGLGLLQVVGHRIRHRELQQFVPLRSDAIPAGFKPATRPFDIFISMKRVEWDTLMFFYGVVLCVGGLVRSAIWNCCRVVRTRPLVQVPRTCSSESRLR